MDLEGPSGKAKQRTTLGMGVRFETPAVPDSKATCGSRSPKVGRRVCGRSWRLYVGANRRPLPLTYLAFFFPALDAGSASSAMRSAMSWSRPSATCWWTNADLGVEWPIRAISSARGRAGLGGHGGGTVSKVVNTEVGPAGDPAGAVVGLAEGVHMEVSGPGRVGEEQPVLTGHRVFGDVAS